MSRTRKNLFSKCLAVVILTLTLTIGVFAINTPDAQAKSLHSARVIKSYDTRTATNNFGPQKYNYKYTTVNYTLGYHTSKKTKRISPLWNTNQIITRTTYSYLPY